MLFLYGQITEMLGSCRSLLLVKPEAKLRKLNRIRTVHSSLAIEGNTLSIEQVTALISGTRVLAPPRDILEAQNAIRAYELLIEFDPYSMDDFLKAHKVMMEGLVESPGRFRNKQVGIMKGPEVQHIAPGCSMVPSLMRDLFDYIRNDTDTDIIKSCVFHYETEFIHPFDDGNGRIGRLWQTRLLMKVNPIFEYLPVEETIRNSQNKYYEALAIADNTGSSTNFIEYMLEALSHTLGELIDDSRSVNIDFHARSSFALTLLEGWFDRKKYMRINKGISSATASRDLRQMLEDGRIESSGAGRLTRYRKVD